MKRKIALVGIGKIAQDQHIPALVASEDWALAATVSRGNGISGIENYHDLATLFTARPDIDTISLTLPPVPRFDYAVPVLKSSRHLMIEKPPGATIAECMALEALAREKNVSLFASWHSQEAQYVDFARNWIAAREIDKIQITWKEDVRRWHPGQDWIWRIGGMGVFDPGINAFSILAKIFPKAISVSKSQLIIPSNCQTPIAANVEFRAEDTEISAALDFRQTGDQIWDIDVYSGAAHLRLSDGGAHLEIDGIKQNAPDTGIEGEYPRLYSRFANLVAIGDIDFDIRPMVHVVDALVLGEIEITDAFIE